LAQGIAAHRAFTTTRSILPLTFFSPEVPPQALLLTSRPAVIMRPVLLALAWGHAAAMRIGGPWRTEREQLAQRLAALMPLPPKDWHFARAPQGVQEDTFGLMGGGGDDSEEDIYELACDGKCTSPSLTHHWKEKPKVMYYNGKYGGLNGMLNQCPKPCRVSLDPEDMPGADAVIWNTGAFNYWQDPPETKPAGQKWVFAAFFEPPNHGHVFVNAKRKETSVLDSNGFVDWTMTFHPKSDFMWPYSQLVPRAWGPGQPPSHPTGNGSSLQALDYFNTTGALDCINELEVGRKIDELKKELHVPRPKVLLAMVSNCMSERIGFLNTLQKFLPEGSMDILGRCGKPSPCKSRNESDQCHQDLFRQYKFYAAFENSRFEGYITEKLFRGFLEGMVPLAVGGRSKSDYEAIGVPEDAFIHVDDFRDMQELADYLTNIDDLDYMRFFAWRKTLRVASPMDTRVHSFCDVCKELHKPPGQQKPSRKSFSSDLVRWWFQQYKGKYCTFNYTS